MYFFSFFSLEYFYSFDHFAACYVPKVGQVNHGSRRCDLVSILVSHVGHNDIMLDKKHHMCFLRIIQA